jgi:myo-inositol catabolism protein IolC
MTTHQQDVRTTDKILRNLNDRGGFDAWWSDIDPVTQAEIWNEIHDTILESHP